MRLQTELIQPREQVTAEKYYYMLECLPPIRMNGNAFLVGEPHDHIEGKARYALYFEKGGQYFYGGLSTTADYDCMLVPETMSLLEAMEKHATDDVRYYQGKMQNSITRII